MILIELNIFRESIQSDTSINYSNYLSSLPNPSTEGSA